MSAVVTLKKGEGRTIKAGGMWIFDNEIDSVMGNFEDGDIVLVHDFDGYPMGKGYINRHSKIRVRLLTRKTDVEIDEEFFRMRLKNAWEDRKKTVDTSSCRIPSASPAPWRSFPVMFPVLLTVFAVRIFAAHLTVPLSLVCPDTSVYLAGHLSCICLSHYCASAWVPRYLVGDTPYRFLNT